MGKPTIIFEKKPHIKELNHVLWCKHINDLKVAWFLNKGIFKKIREKLNLMAKFICKNV